MLNTFGIENFKCFKELSCKELKQVNLFVGKNSVGKSTLLEAMYIFSHEFAIEQLFEILFGRSEDISSFDRNDKITIKDEVNAFLPLVYNRDLSVFSEKGIALGEIAESSWLKLKRVSFEEGKKKIKVTYLPYTDDSVIGGKQYAALTVYDKNHKVLNIAVSLDGGGLSRVPDFATSRKKNIVFLHSNNDNNEKDYLTTAWADVSMTPLEDYVIAALRIIEPRITKFNIIGKDLVPFVYIEGMEKPMRLSSMGDGLNRVLRIILTMIKCKDGLFLVDEIENGLHYTSMYKVWEVIVDIANKLNIQVIATTHSNDCVMSFLDSNQCLGGLHRIEKKSDGSFVVVDYEEDEQRTILTQLKKGFDNNVEIR